MFQVATLPIGRLPESLLHTSPPVSDCSRRMSSTLSVRKTEERMYSSPASFESRSRCSWPSGSTKVSAETSAEEFFSRTALRSGVRGSASP